MKILSSLPLRPTLVWGLTALLATAVACSDPDTDPVDDTTDPGVCDGSTLTVNIGQPEPGEGFAPLSVAFNSQVSLIENVSYNWTYQFGDAAGSEVSGVSAQPSANFEYTEAGTYEVRLIIRDETCNKEEVAQTTVTVLAPVELRGTDLSARPGNATVLDTIRVSMDVVNDADNDLSLPVTVAFFLSPRPGVLWGELGTLVPLTNVTISPENGVSVPAGGATSVSEEVDIPDAIRTGSYFVIGAVDINNEILERDDDERNNLVSSASPVFIENVLEDAPDVIVDTVQVGPSTAFLSLSAISINADLTNIGTRQAETDYSVYVQVGDGPLAEDAEPVFVSDELSIDSVAPDNRFQVRAQQIVLVDPIELPEEGGELEVYIWVCADVDNNLVEENEDNNCALSENGVLISDTPQDGTDIVLSGFDITPRSTFLDGTVEIALDVSNFGTLDTRSFFCAIFLSEDESLDFDDERLTNINFTNIRAGENRAERRVSSVPGFLPVGEFTAFAHCDPSNVVNETFEDNNIRRLDGQVIITAEAIIDLTMSDFTVEPLDLEDGGDLEMTFTIENSGTSGAGPTTLNVRRSLDRSCTGQDELIGSIAVPGLAPESSEDLTLTIAGLQCDIFTSEYNLCLQIDPANSVPETNEQNNLTVVENPLVITGERCACEADDNEPNETPQTASIIADGTIEAATICQPGGKDYYAVDLEVGQSLSVRADLAHEGDCTNLDLQILDATFQPIPDAISQTDGLLEQADIFLVQRAGRYIVRIEGRTGCDINRYDLTVSIASPGPGVDLTGTDLIVNDTNPALGQTVTTNFRTLNIADDDSATYDITVYLSEDAAIDEGDFELATATVDGGLEGARARDDELTFDVPVEATNGGYFVCAKVDSGDAIDEVDEDNNVICSEQIEVDTECYDRFEVNDTPENATDIEPGTIDEINVCNQGRQDFYRFCVEADKEVTVRADFIHADGDIEMRLLQDSEGFPELDSSIGVRDFEEITLEYVNDPTCFIAQVFLNDRNQTSNDYSLTVTVEDGDPLLRCDRAFEPNENPQQAIDAGADLVAAIENPIALDRCPEDDFDFYYVDLVAGPTVTLCAGNDESNPEEYNINLALFDPAQRQIQANTGTNPCITQFLSVTGRYFVRVLSINPQRRAVRYNMTLEGLFGIDLVGRDFSVEPTDIVPGSIDQPLIYSFTLENARADDATDINYGVYYSVDPIIDPLDDFLISEGTVASLEGFSEVDIENVTLVPEDGPYVAGEGFIGVFFDPADTIVEENEQNNRLQAQVNLLVCNDDPNAGNNSPDTGTLINLGQSQADLIICPETNDWFCIADVPPGDYNAAATFALDPDARLDTDLNLQVISVNEQRVETGQLGLDISLGDDASADFTVAEATDVCLRVFPARGSGSNTYSLIVNGLSD